MAQPGQLILVRTNPATQFRGAIAQNAAATLSLAPGGPAVAPVPADVGFLDDGVAASRSVRARLVALTIIAAEDLDWEVWIWGTDQFATPTLLSGQLAPLARVDLSGDAGVQIGATGNFYWFAALLDGPVLDLDQTSELHLMLVNRAAAGKSEGDAGAVQLQLHLAPTLGW